MKILSFYWQVVLLAVLSLSSGVYADSLNVSDVEIEGARRVDSAALKSQIKSRPPNVERSDVSSDIKTLFQLGFFDQVTAVVVDDANQKGKRLVFRVLEKPLVRKTFIRGNKEVDESDLSDVLRIGGNRFLDGAQIKAIVERAKAYYQAQGYFDATIEYSVVPVAENQVDLTFTISEGDRYKIREIKIEGLKDIDPDELISVMQTQEYKWWNSWLYGTGRLNRDLLDNDKTLLRQYFLDHGYVDARLGEPVIEKKDDGLYIGIEVTEGDKYTIGKVTASGDLVDGQAEKTLEGTSLEKGEVFSATKLREDAFTISEKFTDQGFAFANVVPETKIVRELQQVDIDFNTNKGNPVTINRIEISGNDKTFDNVIRRELKVSEQEIYSSSKIKRSQVLLQRLGYFEEINFSTNPTDNPDEVDLNVAVREASTGTLSVGAGFSSSDGVLFNGRVSENNLFGAGRSVSLNADLGQRANNLVLSFDDKRLNDTQWAGGVDLIQTRREYSDFDRKQQGASVSLGHPLEPVLGEWAEDISAAVEYEYFRFEISDVDPADAAQLVIDSEGTSTVSAISPSITRNTIDNPLNPTKGSYQWLSSELAVLGGSSRYYLFEAQNQWYHPLFDTSIGKFVFSWRTKAAYGKGSNGDPLPLFRRFFPGGINSVRGYKNRTLGPKDKNGNEFGGAKQLVNNVEIIFPLFESVGLRGVTFYDVGEAFDDDESIRISDLRQAYGAGLRWSSPLGPIRIEFGFPVDRQPDEKSMVTLFSFGAPF